MLIRILLICFFLYSCAGRMIQTDLYFAQKTQSGKPISVEEWNRFTEDHISKVFIKGSTVHNTEGRWFDPDKKILITEPSYMVSYVYKRSRLVSLQIDSLRATYQRLFDQQSVMRVDRKVKARF